MAALGSWEISPFVDFLASIKLAVKAKKLSQLQSQDASLLSVWSWPSHFSQQLRTSELTETDRDRSDMQLQEKDRTKFTSCSFYILHQAFHCCIFSGFLLPVCKNSIPSVSDCALHSACLRACKSLSHPKLWTLMAESQFLTVVLEVFYACKAHELVGIPYLSFGFRVF